MPQHEVGYRTWNGRLTGQHSRWWIIAESGFQLVFKSMWVRRLLFLAWLPIFYWGTVFFFIENLDMIRPDPGLAPQLQRQIQNAEVNGVIVNQPAVPTQQRQPNRRNRPRGGPPGVGVPPQGPPHGPPGFPPDQQADFMEGLEKGLSKAEKIQFQKAVRVAGLKRTLGWLPGATRLTEAIESGDADEQRHVAWSWLLMTFFRYPQATMIIFLLGFISPGLISRDFRSRAYLLYFSKPIGRIEYILGKFAIPAVYLILVTTLPALILYVLGVSLSPDLSVISITWDIPLKILLASVVLIIPTATLSLMLSALTHESRFASFAWFAVWLLGHGAWLAIWLGRAIQADTDPSRIAGDPIIQRWSFLSLYNNLGNVQSWIFGLDTFSNALPGIIVLTLITVISLLVLFRRVSAPVNV